MTKPQIAMASSAEACGVAGIGCGAYFLSENLNSYIDTTTLSPESKTIKSHLQGDGFSVLDVNGDSNHWTTLKDKYKQLNGKLGKGAEGDSDIDEAKLKELCKEALEQEYAEGSTYDQTIKWCIVPVSVTEHLKKKGFTALTEDLLKSENHKWIVSTYDNGHDTISGLSKINGDGATLVSKCTESGKKQNYEDGFYKDLISIRQWCFVQ
ncbi:hypothetical protein MHF_0992 [Mycoplasma haemofelis Ohio2]|uniref:Uncharacterized protein n=1 Tax=Mycoplasma haemofelis (strain Ohio2) TaxID=859194 RepID=F6FJ49_MYCHI|nr:hypothetical protein MHF_0992 [Mycoplasma haemofelis Ohio2]